MLLLYVDPGTAGAFFSGLSTVFAALGGGALVALGLLCRPLRRLCGWCLRRIPGVRKRAAASATDAPGSA